MRAGNACFPRLDFPCSCLDEKCFSWNSQLPAAAAAAAVAATVPGRIDITHSNYLTSRHAATHLALPPAATRGPQRDSSRSPRAWTELSNTELSLQADRSPPRARHPPLNWSVTCATQTARSARLDAYEKCELVNSIFQAAEVIALISEGARHSRVIGLHTVLVHVLVLVFGYVWL